MVELTAKQLAETYAEAARQNYTRDGHLLPVVHVLDRYGSGITLVPSPDRFGGQPREQLQVLTMLTADAIETVYVATITEGWIKTFPGETADPPDLERGQLSREAETDPTIGTALMIHVIDVRDAAGSYNILDQVGGDDPREVEWSRHEQEGTMDGAFPDAIVSGYNLACLGIAPLPDFARESPEARVKFLASIDFIVAALYTEAADD